jgi:hypothetical protein
LARGRPCLFRYLVDRAGEFAFQELAPARLQLCHVLTSLLRMAIADCANTRPRNGKPAS